MRTFGWFVIAAVACGSPRSTSRPATKPPDQVRFEPQLAHPGRIAAMALSHDGRFAVTAGEVAKLWDLETGAILRTYSGAGKGGFGLVAFAGTDVWLLDREGRGTLRDALTGATKRTVTDTSGVTEATSAATISRDGTLLATVIGTGQLRVSELATGKQRWSVDPNQRLGSLAFSSDGTLLLVTPGNVSGDTSPVLLFEVATGRVKHSFAIPGCLTVAISPDNRHAACGTFQGVRVWNLEGDPALFGSDNEKIQVKGITFAGNNHVVAFSVTPKSDADFFVDDGISTAALVIDVTTKQSQSLGVAADGEDVSEDGTRFATYAFGRLAIYDVATVRLAQQFERPHPRAASSVSWSPDGRRLAVGGALWDVANLHLERRMGDDDKSIDLVRFLDKDHVDVWLHSFEIASVDLASWRVVESKVKLPPYARLCDRNTDCLIKNEPTFVSDDGRDVYVVVGSGTDTEAILYKIDSATGAEAQRTSKSSLSRAEGAGRRTSNGGKFPLRVRHPEGDRIEVWDTRASTIATSFEVHDIAAVDHLWLSPDTKTIAVEIGEEIQLRTAADGTLRGRWPVRGAVGLDFLTNDRAIVASADGTIAVWNVAATTPAWSQRRHVGAINDLALSPDHRFAASASADGTARIWRVDTGASVALVSVGLDWLVYDNDGYFDASRNGGTLVSAIDGASAYRIDLLATRNNRPDLLLGGLGVGDPGAIEHYRALYQRRLARSKLDGDSLGAAFTEVPRVRIVDAATTGKTMKLTFEINGVAELRAYNLWANGVPLFPGDGKPLSGRSTRLTETVELTGGANRIEVGAVDRRGAESLRAYRVVDYDNKTPGDLYYLAFGVSHYRNSEYDLAYAHKDVADLRDVLAAAPGYAHIHTKVITDREVTVDGIRNAKQFLAGAKVDDTVVLFVAGHGLHAPDQAADYYYATYEVDLERLATTAAPFNVIEDLLVGLAARRKLFLIDTCESGELDPGDRVAAITRAGARNLRSRGLIRTTKAPASVARPAAPRTFLFDRDRYIYADTLRRTGAIVLSASRGAESSYELDELKNGAFTEALIQSLTGTVEKIDLDGDGRLSTAELSRALARDVPARTQELQHPTIDHDNTDVVLSLPLVPAAQRPEAR